MGEFEAERNLMAGKCIGKGLQVSCCNTEKLLGCNTYLHYPSNNSQSSWDLISLFPWDGVWALQTALTTPAKTAIHSLECTILVVFHYRKQQEQTS